MDITATPGTGYEFTAWSGDLEGNTNPAGAISVQHSDETIVGVGQIPEGSAFDGWDILSGSSVSFADPLSLSTTMRLESGNAMVRANFKDSTTVGMAQFYNEAGSLDIFSNPAMDYMIVNQKTA